MKVKTAYVCSECGAVALQWFGSCPSCGAAGTLSEAAGERRAGTRSASRAVPLEEVQIKEVARTSSGIAGGSLCTVNNSRPAIDITLSSCAFVYKEKLVGILLSGANKDGALGMKHIHDRNGLTIVQEPTECMIDTMPKAALAATEIDYVMKVDQIVEFLKELDKQYR